MAKAPVDTVKYNVYATIKIDGVVEKADVVGALFGQSEGLLGEELELRDLQKSGRIGRIEVDITTNNGKSTGKVTIPSSLDMVETSIIAAAIEGVDRVGPCNAEIHINKVEDARNTKRKKMVVRAQDILKTLVNDELPDSMELTDEVKKAVQLSEITTYNGLPAGPSIETSDTVIFVEGRADVINLLKCGIKNGIGVGGTNIPKEIKDLSRKKNVIVFVDGDRGGQMILKELMQVADIDFVATAPEGKEVEELTKKEVIMSLRRKVPSDQVKPGEVRGGGGKFDRPDRGRDQRRQHFSAREQRPPQSGGRDQRSQPASRESPQDPRLAEALTAINGKLVAKFFDESMGDIAEVEIKDLIDTLSDVKPAYVVLDGIITQRLVDACENAGVKIVVGVNTAAKLKTNKVKVATGA
ncbi:MAG TPA: DNA primase [Candidatus Altiarchaeales archaeon]|nr:DNA primase [Candidatus Altiarchaeales archaeon]